MEGNDQRCVWNEFLETKWIDSARASRLVIPKENKILFLNEFHNVKKKTRKLYADDRRILFKSRRSIFRLIFFFLSLFLDFILPLRMPVSAFSISI